MTLLTFLLLPVLLVLFILLPVFIYPVYAEIKDGWSLDFVEAEEWRNIILCILGIVLVIAVIIIGEGPPREDILKNGERKEVTVLSIGDGSPYSGYEPYARLEDGREVHVEPENVRVSKDGKNRAFEYRETWSLFGRRLGKSYREYILYLTPETLRTIGIVVNTDEEQTEPSS